MMTDTNAEQIVATRHDADGHVYLGYFRNDVNTGFVWDGNIEHPIQVTREMGEPIIDTFEMPDLAERTAPHHLFHLFKQACDRYADNPPLF